MLHKRGAVGEQLSIVYFLFLAVIIGASIAIGIWMFYGEGYDFKQAEADFLNKKIQDCILENNINEDFFERQNLFTTCALDEEQVKKNNIIKICDGFKEDCLTSSEAFFVLGSNFNLCRIKNAGDSKGFPKCSINGIEKDRRRYVIITGSNQVSRRIRG